MYGLVLEGGGARGAYHVGAYKALIEEGIEINGIAGTSIGALNGALFIQGDYDIAYKIWQEISYSQIIVANDQKIEKLKQLKIDKEDVSFLLEKTKEILSEKGFDITPLKNLISEYIDEDKIRNSGKDFAIVTVSLTDWKPLELHIEDIPVGKLSQYIMASAYLPIFKKETFDGKRYLDGGIYNNLPVNLLKEKNYKNLIIVRTHALGHVKKFDLEGYNVINISPKKGLGRTFDLDIEAIRNNIQLGYYDGLKALRNLKGYNYYIKNIEDENYFINFLSTLSKEKVLELRDLFKIDTEIPYKRSLFEHIIPKLSNLLGVEKEATYNDIFYALIEKLAELYKVEALKVYSCDELTRLAKEHFELEKGKKIGIVDKVIEKVDLLSLFNKEEMIKEAGKIIL